jgi:hypothetical protein
MLLAIGCQSYPSPAAWTFVLEFSLLPLSFSTPEISGKNAIQNYAFVEQVIATIPANLHVGVYVFIRKQNIILSSPVYHQPADS